MNRKQIASFAFAVALVASLYGWSRRVATNPRPAPVIVEDEKHLVTPEMASASVARIGLAAPGFEKPTAGGATERLEDLLRDGPVLLTFIKVGCPCSESAQSSFNELHAAYPGVAIRGVIDVEAEKARGWADRFHAAYPLLLDPDEDLVRDYGAENSAYVVLIEPGGAIANHWPGYSGPMLRELGALMARLSGTAERPLDFPDAPEELYTGCPYGI
ncbi:peroxiredoxin family protein [Paludisphaera soli]|uniref:peroxiredoxin family protein n=1 Tax=Paludisphaera soli TaxID=2712865 RepID=UPI0013EB7B4D|nr:redoxin domain-containing protein [Paludisphaera soli]